MTLDEAKKAMVKFVELKTTLRPAFVDPILKAEEVIRCEDCKWRNGLRCYHKRSSMDDLVGENEFCSWGERREDGNEPKSV